MTLPERYVDYFAGDAPKEGALTVDPGEVEQSCALRSETLLSRLTSKPLSL